MSVTAAATVNHVRAPLSGLLPRSVSPYGVTLGDSYASVTGTVNDNMSDYAVCATNPKPASVLGIACFNGTTNGTFVFNVTGFELRQQSYQFQYTGYGNGTVKLVFIGIAPAFILADTIVQSATYNSGSETIVNSKDRKSVV